MLNPAGKPSAPKLIGVVPVAVFVKLKNSPCRPVAVVGLVNVAGAATSSLTTALVTVIAGFETNTS